MARRRTTRRYDAVGPLISGAEAARRLQISYAALRLWRESGRVVRGRHYVVNDRGRCLWNWPRLAADFVHN